MKALAAWRDLSAIGLTYGIKLEIDDLPSLTLLWSKMHKLWKQRLHIYLGKDLKAAASLTHSENPGVRTMPETLPRFGMNFA